MKEEIANIQSDALTAIETAAGEQQLEEVRIAFLGCLLYTSDAADE